MTETDEIKLLLAEPEIVDKSMIIVIMESGNFVPFLVHRKIKSKAKPGASYVLGETLDRVILSPYVYPFREPALSRLHMLGGLNRINIGVKGFRRPTVEEREICQNKIRQINQISESIKSELIEFIEKDY